MADVVSELVKGNENLNRQFVGYSSSVNVSRIINENLKVVNNISKITHNLISGDVLIWNNTEKGIWNTNYWGNSEDRFVVSSADYGVLGTNKLGGSLGTTVIDVVVNKNNTFTEIFRHSDFINTIISTGTLTTSTGVYSFVNGQVLRTNIVAKNDEAYINGLLTLSGTNVSSLSCSASFDGGTSWNSIVNETVFNIGNTSVAGIMLNLVASSTCSLTKIELVYN